MKSTITLILFFLNINCFAQISWIRDYDLAMEMAISQKKFIVMDFWATWCGPCLEMDSKMWNTKKITPMADKFIALKIDIDHNKALANRFSVSSIPMVVIIDPSGNVIWKQIGFLTASTYFPIFEQIPASTLPVDAMKKEVSNEGDLQSWTALATSYQQQGKNLSSSPLSLGFFKLSDRYFKKIQKKYDDETIVLSTKMNMILNNAYRGQTKRALKQINKLGGDNTDLKNYILAYCYKCNGQMNEMQEFKNRINDKDLIAQLDN